MSHHTEWEVAVNLLTPSTASKSGLAGLFVVWHEHLMFDDDCFKEQTLTCRCRWIGGWGNLGTISSFVRTSSFATSLWKIDRMHPQWPNHPWKRERIGSNPLFRLANTKGYHHLCTFRQSATTACWRHERCHLQYLPEMQSPVLICRSACRIRIPPLELGH